MGITTKLDGNPAEVIGGLTLGVTPLEMADAYATVANGGWHVPATSIDKVAFPDGSTVNMGSPPKKQVFSYAEASAAIDVLKQVITNSGGTGTAANYGCPAAGKTGTAENLENAWFVGFTPKASTAVWVGYPNANTPMAGGFGGTLAAPIWHDYMQSASNGYCGDWSQPTDPFHGSAFTGPHSGPSGPSGPGSGNGNGSGGGNGNGFLQNGGGGPNAYNNPQLYAQPPQGPPQVRVPNGGRTGGAPPAGFGTGRTGGGGGGGARKTR
jgi:penicillin-binding protein 1A